MVWKEPSSAAKLWVQKFFLVRYFFLSYLDYLCQASEIVSFFVLLFAVATVACGRSPRRHGGVTAMLVREGGLLVEEPAISIAE